MTTQHMYQGLTMAMRTTRLSTKLGLHGRTVSEMKHGTQKEIVLGTLDIIHRNSGVSLDQLMAWYRLPEGAPIEIYRKQET
jgi:DNA-binding Xre family transcriptional regulator